MQCEIAKQASLLTPKSHDFEDFGVEHFSLYGRLIRKRRNQHLNSKTPERRLRCRCHPTCQPKWRPCWVASPLRILVTTALAALHSNTSAARETIRACSTPPACAANSSRRRTTTLRSRMRPRRPVQCCRPVRSAAASRSVPCHRYPEIVPTGFLKECPDFFHGGPHETWMHISYCTWNLPVSR